ncbi:MAG: nickel-dependent hydrogenase large subunit [Pseudomonadota bacterium]
MATIKIIDPVTRIEGHLKIMVSIDKVNGKQQVVDAWASGTMFRGVEKILIGRHPWDAPHITQRICGVCPVPHGMAAVLALDSASGVTPPENARILRNLVLGANFIDSHLLHFYLLTMPDYMDGPNMPPWQPGWGEDLRFDAPASAELVKHYVTALNIRRTVHEMGALFGGKLPHPPSYIPGGFTTTPTPDRIAKCKAYLNEIIPFIEDTYIADARALSLLYDDYFFHGKGTQNLLAFGCFDLDTSGSKKLFPRGRTDNGSAAIQAVDAAAIAEQVSSSWYADNTGNLNPASGATTPEHPKTRAYSWLKAPRYSGQTYETGSLARMRINAEYTRGISVMDRHLARALEALKIAKALEGWVDELAIGAPVYTDCPVPAAASSCGLTEGPRGALGHWLHINKSRISRYQVITPTCWNASPRDTIGQRGPIEEALIGTPVNNIEGPIEVLRIIHSFDPCMSCAVHVLRPGDLKKMPRIY